jgi:hypothetical protein
MDHVLDGQRTNQLARHQLVPIVSGLAAAGYFPFTILRYVNGALSAKLEVDTFEFEREMGAICRGVVQALLVAACDSDDAARYDVSTLDIRTLRPIQPLDIACLDRICILQGGTLELPEAENVVVWHFHGPARRELARRLDVPASRWDLFFAGMFDEWKCLCAGYYSRWRPQWDVPAERTRLSVSSWLSRSRNRDPSGVAVIARRGTSEHALLERLGSGSEMWPWAALEGVALLETMAWDVISRHNSE